MRHAVLKVAACLGLTATLWSSAAHAEFTAPTNNHIVDSQSGLEWFQTTDLSAAQVAGFRLATTVEATQLISNAGFFQSPSNSVWYAWTPFGATAPASPLAAFSPVACGTTSDSPQVCRTVAVVTSGSGLGNADQVIDITRRVDTTGPGPGHPDDAWSAQITSPTNVSGGIYGFSNLAQATDGAWFTSSGRYVAGFDPVKQQVIYADNLLTRVPHMVVREVPEASTWLMLTLGLGLISGLQVVRRRPVLPKRTHAG